MNILIDFITLHRQTGAGEYLRRVIARLLQDVPSQVSFFGVYDSNKGIAYSDCTPQQMKAHGVTMADVSQTTLCSIIEKYHIDRFFIGCAQYVGSYEGLERISCQAIVVIHDLAYEEQWREGLDVYYRWKSKSLVSFVNWLAFHRKRDMEKNDVMQPYVKMIHSNDNHIVVAVSEFTRHSIVYTLGIPEERIRVLYSPERKYSVTGEEIEHPLLKEIVEEKRRFILLLGAQNQAKNAQRAVNAFAHYANKHEDVYLVSVGYRGEPLHKRHLMLPFLSEGDLQKAYQECSALLYPSLFEGFGYPPLEAMHYGKPVLASNIGPIREVFGDAPVYFNPFSETDIYQALCSLTPQKMIETAKRSKLTYLNVSARQEKDLDTLIKILIEVA